MDYMNMHTWGWYRRECYRLTSKKYAQYLKKESGLSWEQLYNEIRDLILSQQALSA